jgi:hypothetical protein
MGTEFIRKAAASYTKAINRERANLGTAEFFRNAAIEVTRTIAIEIGPQANIKVGDEVVIERQGTALVARRSLSEVGRADCPRPEIAAAIDQSGGIARGVVVQVNEISGVAEVLSC